MVQTRHGATTGADHVPTGSPAPKASLQNSSGRNDSAASWKQLLSWLRLHAVPHVAPTLNLALWTLTSSWLIILNKVIMVDKGFKYPMMLTAVGQVTCSVAGSLVSYFGMLKLGKPPTPQFFMSRLLPVAACTAGTLFFGNYAYLSLSVAFIQILKVLVPAVTLLVCLPLRLERLTWSLGLAVLLIGSGTAAAVAGEGGGTFSWLGFNSFAFSVLLEALRVVIIQLLMGGSLRYNPNEIVVYLGLPTGILLLIASLLFERHGLLNGGLAILAAHPALVAVAALLCYAVNLTSYLAIRATSSLTYKVFGCVKNTAVVAAGVLMGDHVSLEQYAGYAVSVAGFLLYTYAKTVAARAPSHKKHS